MDWNYFDIVVVIVLIYAAYSGFTKGLIISLASIVGLILGVYGAFHFSEYASTFLWEQFELQIPILSFALTFAVILFGVYFLGKLMEKFINILSLGFLNKLGGLLFSVTKMLLIVAVILMIVEESNGKYQLFDFSIISNSFLFPYIKAVENVLLPFIKEFKP